MIDSVLPHSFWRYAQASVLANFIIPYVALTEDLCVVARNLFPSGFLQTLMGNTDVYLAVHWETMYDYFCHLKLICRCPDECRWGGIRFCIEELLDALIVEQQGDDHSRLRTVHARLIDEVKMRVWGIIIEFEEGPLSQAVFLQKKVTMYRGMPILASDPYRILAKAWHLAGDLADVREGLDSLALECGDLSVFNVLQAASAVIGRREVTCKNNFTNPEVRYGRLGGSEAAFELVHAPDHQVVRLVRTERAFARFGMSTRIAVKVFKKV